MSIVLNYRYTPNLASALVALGVTVFTPFLAYGQVSEGQVLEEQFVETQASVSYMEDAPVTSASTIVDVWTEPDIEPPVIEEPVVTIVPGYEGCEIVLIEPVAKGASLASYRPADDFIESIYDEEEGFQETVGSLKIRAVMCTRDRVIPQLRDFPILESGVQFSISNDFDSHDSQFMTVFYKGGTFQHKFSGPSLSEGEQIALRDVMEIYNLQEHDLDATK